MINESSEMSNNEPSAPSQETDDPKVIFEKFVKKFSEIEILQNKTNSALAAAELAREDTQKAYEASLVLQTKMQSAHEAIVTLKSSAEQKLQEILQSATAVASAKTTIDAAATAVTDSVSIVSATKSSIDEIHRQLTQMSSTAEAALSVVNAEREKAIQVNSIIEAAKLTAANASKEVSEAKVAIESSREEAKKINTEIQTIKSGTSLTLTEINEIKVAVEAAAQAVKKDLTETEKAAAEVLASKNAVTANLQDVDQLKEQAIALEREINVSAKSAADAGNLAQAEAKRAQEAHNLSTTAGLAGAFNEKARDSANRGRLWSAILLTSLGAAATIGWWRYSSLTEFIATKPDPGPLAAEVVLALFGVGAPIWLAWVATRMVSKSFALTEDYAYKAALAKAYVGFREQAKQLGDPIFEQRLFAAAVTQLDANPVRLLDASHPGSPLQDLLQQPFIQKALDDASFKKALVEWINSRFKAKLPVPIAQPYSSPAATTIMPAATPPNPANATVSAQPNHNT